MKNKLAYLLFGIGLLGLLSLVMLYLFSATSLTATPDNATHTLPKKNNASNQHTLWVKPETFNVSSTPIQLEPSLYSYRAGVTISSTRHHLATLSPDEKQKILSNVGLQISRKPEPIGIVRPLNNTLPDQIKDTDLTWFELPNGKIAHWVVQSSGALALRLQLNVNRINTGGEIRFFSLDDISKTYKAFDKTQLMPNGAGKSFWSPTVQGDAIGIEIFIPKTAGNPDIVIDTPQLSHIYKPLFGMLESLPSTSTRAADVCHIDIACAAQSFQEVANAVAKYIYVDGQYAYYCTGTLLSDTDNSSQLPYFITANHCVDNTASAESMELYWLYQNDLCSNGSASTAQVTHSGSTLLINSTDSDLSFMLLNENPPNGTTLSGWTTTELTPNDNVHGIHHPEGDVKKYSNGTFTHFESIVLLGNTFYVSQDPDGNFMQVVWSEGITAGGSSGSGLWINNEGTPYLVGTLLGGTSFCSTPQAPDDYGRFDRGYPLISQWLDPNASSTPDLNFTTVGDEPVALKDGVLLARYLMGLRGSDLVDGIAESENVSDIEARLAANTSQLDVDGDGEVTADQDSLLIIRYMMDIRGESLTEGALSAGATRTHPIEIELFLDDLFAQQ